MHIPKKIENGADMLSSMEAVELEVNGLTMLSIIGHLQLALRHPSNGGPSSQVVRNFLSEFEDRMDHSDFSAMMRAGENENYDQAPTAIPVPAEATCVRCRCSESNACLPAGCAWVWVDRDRNVGWCTGCEETMADQAGSN